MKSFPKIQKRIEEELNDQFSPLGFPKRSKSRGDFYLKSTPIGFNGVRFMINDHGCIATRMYLLIKFDAVVRSEQLSNLPSPDWLSRKDRDQADKFAITYESSYEQIVGMPDWSFETIDSEVEIPTLCNLWRERFLEIGPPYFSRYGNLDFIAKLVRQDDPELNNLSSSEGMRYLTGAAVIHSCDGHKALLDYVNKHNLKYRGIYRGMIDRLVSASEKLLEGKE